MEDYFLWYKSIHIISVIFWMAAMLYMPRLFVYHVDAKKDSEMDKTFQVMENRLLKFIMNPAMILTYFFGFLTAYVYGMVALGAWFHIKMLVVLILTIFHAFLARSVKAFARGENSYSKRFFKIINEVPAILIIIAVIMVVIKPFE